MKNRRTAIIFSYTYFCVNSLVSLFLSSYLVKTLGAIEYGVYQTVVSFTAYLAVLNFGIGTVMTRNIVASKVSEEKNEEDNIATLTWLTIIICAVILLGGFILYHMIDVIYQNSLTEDQIIRAKPMFILAILNLVVTLGIQTMEGIVHGNDDYLTPKVLSLFKIILRCVMIFTLFQFKKSAICIVLTDLILNITVTTVLILFCKKWYKLKRIFSIKRFRYAIFIDTIPFASAMILQVFVNQAITQMPKFIVSVVLNPAAVTVISIAIYIYNMFSSVLSIPVSIFLPDTVRRVTKGAVTDWSFLIKPCRLNSMFGGVILFGFIALGRQFVILMYGAEQEIVWVAAIILLIPMYLNMINAVSVNVLDALNKRLSRSIIIAVTACLSLVLTILTIGRFGLFAAIFSIGLSLLLGNTVIMSFYYRYRIGINVLDLYKHALKGILPSCILSGIVSYVISSKCPVSWGYFVLNGFLFVILFAICMLLFGFTEEEKQYLKNVLRKGLHR